MGTEYDSEYVAAIEEDRLFEFSGFASGHVYDSEYLPAPDAPTEYFRMRGIDITCPLIQQPAYVYWTVTGSADYTAAQLNPSALPCGTDPLTDVADITIAGQWEVLVP